jgi:hypothetical protein
VNATEPLATTPLRNTLQDAIRYWEPRRVGYNLALTALAGALVLKTWPHFQPALAWSSIPPLAVLAALANVCYCAVYLAEAVAGPLGPGGSGRHWRSILWIGGTLLALFIECYWILDEIYPAVPFVR